MSFNIIAGNEPPDNYAAVERKFHEIIKVIFENCTGPAWTNAMDALENTMKPLDDAEKLRRMNALQVELNAPIIQTCPKCGEGQGGCVCDLPSIELQDGEGLPV